jgi:hypothetical protein
MHPFLKKYDQVGISALNKEGLEQVSEWIAKNA